MVSSIFWDLELKMCATNYAKLCIECFVVFRQNKKIFPFGIVKKAAFFQFFLLKNFFRLLKRKTLCGKCCLECCAHFETKISKNGWYHKKLFDFFNLWSRKNRRKWNAFWGHPQITFAKTTNYKILVSNF